MKTFFRILCFVLLSSYFFLSCTTIDLYESSVSIPGHEWKSSYKPDFHFTITDTTKPYKLFLVLRHTDKYDFNNLYLNFYIKGPGSDSILKRQQDVTLATNDSGWLGNGMDDIYEHRILLEKHTLKAGEYSFTIEQIMREDPLKNVLNVGLRLEKDK
ncbi:MAG: gliding motility lipoprotein GldH [Chitinophagaceae bacterium]